MYYAPHKLYKRIDNVVRNEYNEVISQSQEWKLLGDCRCDDNTTEHFETENGKIYTPKYHIVCDKCHVSAGDYIKVLNADGAVRGSGKVYNSPKCNYLNYMDVYV